MPTAAGHRPRSSSTRSAGRSSRPRWSRSCRPTGPPGDTRTRAQQLGRRARPAGRQHARRRAACRSCAPSSRTWSSPSTSTTSSTRATGPGAGRTGFGGDDLRRPGPLAGLRRQHQPHHHRPRRAAAGPAAAPTGRPTAPAPGRRGARPALRLRRLRRPDPLVRRPPPAPLDRRRRDPLENSATAVRAPPHQGPPRLPGRTTTRRPMAHLPPRRHRDPHPGRALAPARC